MADSYLQALVTSKCKELGVEKSAEFFEVGAGLVRQWMNGSKSPSLAAVERVFELPDSKPKEASWEGKNIFVASPMYRTTNPGTLLSLLALWDRSKMGFRVRFGDAFVTHAREQLAQDFLISGMEWMWTVDDDVIPPFANAAIFNEITGLNLPEKYAGLHTVNRLLSHNKTVVGGLYVTRNKYGRGVYAEALAPTPEGRAENARLKNGPFDELKATDWLGTGCVLIHRQVFLDVQEKNPHLAAVHPSEPFHFFSPSPDAIMNNVAMLKEKMEAAALAVKEGKAEEAENLLKDMYNSVETQKTDVIKYSRLQQGEDQVFFHRAKLAGHQPYVDLGLWCGHLGNAVWAPNNTQG